MYICLHRKPVLYLRPEKKEIIQSKNKIICLAFIKENENLALYYQVKIVYGNNIIVMEIRKRDKSILSVFQTEITDKSVEKN